MGKSSYLTIRIDPQVKAESSELFRTLGFTMTDAITIFLHQSLMKGGLPFNVDNSAKKLQNLSQDYSQK